MEFFAQKKMRAVPMIRSTCDPGKHRDLKKHGAEDLGNSRFPAGTGTQVRRDHRSLGTGLLRRKVRRDSQPAKGSARRGVCKDKRKVRKISQSRPHELPPRLLMLLMQFAVDVSCCCKDSTASSLANTRLLRKRYNNILLTDAPASVQARREKKPLFFLAASNF